MKRFIALVLSLVVGLSLSACGNDEPTVPTLLDSTEESTGSTDTTTGSAGVTEPEETEPPIVVDPNVVDVSQARETTSANDPAKRGEWVKSTRYAPATETYETIYWRIVSTTDDCAEDIERYNSENHEYMLSESTNEDFGYFKVTYQVYFPEDFPTDAEGNISYCTLALSYGSLTGGLLEDDSHVYAGLGGYVTDISKTKSGKAGEAFTGEAVYIMLKDGSLDYGFWYSHNVPDPALGEESTTNEEDTTTNTTSDSEEVTENICVDYVSGK